MIRINLGCGADIMPAPWVNCDQYAELAGVDAVFDFGVDPWPFADGSADAIKANHCLEHSRGIQHVMTEAYRVLVPGGEFMIVVPHPRSEFYIGDPTHVLPITRDMVMLFSREWCAHCQSQGKANTPLALRLGVDFRVTSSAVHLAPFWRERLLNEDESIKDQAEFDFAVRSYNNVVDSLVFILTRV